MRLLWLFITIIAAVVLFVFFNNDNQITTINNDNLAGLTYAGILVTVIAAGIVSSDISLSHILKSTLIWLALLAILISCYTNRYHLQDIAHNISGGLIPASVLSIALSNRNTVTINQSSNGHYQIKGIVNNHNVYFLIDTGATSIMLTNQTAIDLGLNIQNLHYTTTVSTANGKINAAQIRLNTITIGSITRNNLSALIAPAGTSSDNLLGMNFINTLSSTAIRGSQLMLID